MTLQFKEIPDMPGYYASSAGLIYNKMKAKFIMIHQRESVGGYMTLVIKGKNLQAHRLVAAAWLPSKPGKPLVNHKDGNKKNNVPENLEYVSAKENANHARTVLKTKSFTRKVCQISFDGKLIATFESIKEASEKTGANKDGITKVCKKARRQDGGFIWCYDGDYKGEPIRKLAHCKPVLQYSLTGKFIARHESAKDAATVVSALSSNISNACTGRLKTCYGFVWKYETPAEPKPVDETNEWKTIEEYPLYKISKDGRVYSAWTKTFKKYNDRKGYKFYSVTDKTGVERKIGGHRLVAMAYLPNPNNYPIVNHKDGVPSNNNVENLEWCTASHNIRHAHSMGLVGPPRKKTVDELGNEVTVYHGSKPVIQYTKCHKEVARYSSIKDAAAAVGMSHSAISKVCCKNTKLKTAGGFLWEFA